MTSLDRLVLPLPTFEFTSVYIPAGVEIGDKILDINTFDSKLDPLCSKNNKKAKIIAKIASKALVITSETNYNEYLDKCVKKKKIKKDIKDLIFKSFQESLQDKVSASNTNDTKDEPKSNQEAEGKFEPKEASQEKPKESPTFEDAETSETKKTEQTAPNNDKAEQEIPLLDFMKRIIDISNKEKDKFKKNFPWEKNYSPTVESAKDTLWNILGCNINDLQKEIKAARRRLHPDKVEEELKAKAREAFNIINELVAFAKL